MSFNLCRICLIPNGEISEQTYPFLPLSLLPLPCLLTSAGNRSISEPGGCPFFGFSSPSFTYIIFMELGQFSFQFFSLQYLLSSFSCLSSLMFTLSSMFPQHCLHPFNCFSKLSPSEGSFSSTLSFHIYCLLYILVCFCILPSSLLPANASKSHYYKICFLRYLHMQSTLHFYFGLSTYFFFFATVFIKDIHSPNLGELSKLHDFYLAGSLRYANLTYCNYLFFFFFASRQRWAYLDNFRGTFRWHICFNFGTSFHLQY